VSEVEATLELQKDLVRHLRAGHPWVFRKAIERAPRGLEAGAIVDVVEGGRFVARGYLDPHSAITVRILTREPAEQVDDAFWRGRIRRALALRSELVHGTTGYRLVHGENDGLPGVVADRYGDFVVLKLYSAGLTPHRGRIVDARRSRGSQAFSGATRCPATRNRTTRSPRDVSSGAPRPRTGSRSTSTG
jgi:23S rRNA (cytosine1962-C5)-methyltransferase